MKDRESVIVGKLEDEECGAEVIFKEIRQILRSF